ncbi:MAG: SWIM zinc finger family protein [Methanobrevibacter sp.]|jgi:uncharacterized Zn finger protein|nr:SWIM zinc finger family protein [Candidatus Methanovirga basalitermitum]
MVKYGKTWWGNKWLDALNQIDFTNRLPRGRMYANTSKVYDIQINGNVISAKVKGNYAPYYNAKIMLKSFNSNDKKIITEIVNNSFSILSSLMNNKLPEELYVKLSQYGIQLFPESWDDLNGDCDCPDYAIPCKHIAGLVYMIANEIDKDPFTAFRIHNSDLLSLIPYFDKLDKDSKINGLDDIFLKSSGRHIETVESSSITDKEKILENIDFSQIPDLFDHIFALLTSKPIFYEKDFKKSTEGVYKTLKRKYYTKIDGYSILPSNLRKTVYLLSDKGFDSEDKKLEKKFTNQWGNPYTLENFRINLDKNYNINRVVGHDNKDEDFFKEYNESLAEAIIGLIVDIPQHTLYRCSYTLKYLHFLNQFARELLRKSAFIPEIMQDSDNQAIIRWVPALFSKKLVNIYEDLVKSVPNDLLTYNNKKIHVEEQVKTFLSLILSQLIHSLLNQNMTQKFERELKNPVFKLFYLGERQKFDSFETKVYKEIIKQWLSNLNIRERDYNLFLKVNEKNEFFTIDLEVSFDDNVPELVYEFISNKKNYM